MPDFTELPIAKGVGEWHLNRFRVVFRLQPTSPPMSAFQLAGHFINNFPNFVRSPAATVQHFKQPGQSLFKFHGAVPVLGMAAPHYDWVKVIWLSPTRGFTVQTLHRDSPDTDDVQAGAMGGAAAGLAGASAAFLINRFHILAGRRSWLLQPASALTGVHDPRFPATDFVLETAAIERISIWPYYAGASVIENSLPPVWINLLANFVSRLGLQPVSWPTEPGWRVGTKYGVNVHWYKRDFANEAQLLSSASAQDVIRVFHDILDTSQQPTGELQQVIDKIKSLRHLPIFEHA